MQKYQVLGVIGEGAYGVVLRCRNTETKELVAIKKFKETQEDEIVKKTTVREVKVLRMLNQQNIVELKEAFRKKGIVCLVFEYLQFNLLEVLEKSSSGLKPELIRHYTYQMLKGLAYMHALNMIHRDIKPQNLLVSDKNLLKICDFGFARLLRKNESQQFTDYVATRWYRPPELLIGSKYSKEIDLWAVGCIFGELIDGVPMFPGENEIDQLFLIQKCLGPLRPDQYQTFSKNPRFLGMKFPDITSLDSIEKRYLGKLSPKALNFLKSLLKMQPAQRLTALEALRHPYFDGMREEEFIRKLSPKSEVQRTISANTPKQQVLIITHQRKKTNGFVPVPFTETNQQQRMTPSQPRGRIQIRKQPPPPATHSKSVNRNSNIIKRNQQKQSISLEKHYKKDILAKTQAGAFYIQPTVEQHLEHEEQDTLGYSRNKIYGLKVGSKDSVKKSSKKAARTVQGEQEQNVYLSTGQLGAVGLREKPMDIAGMSYYGRRS